MTRPHRADVCVLGGGPAGSVAALRLAALGYEVCLVERSPFPRRRVGESLTSGIWPLLDEMGLRGRVEDAGGFPSAEAMVEWAGKRVDRIGMVGRGAGLLVDRGRFDALLLAAAMARGVRTMQPAAARRVRRVEGGVRVEVAGEAGPCEIEARFVVDASGRGGVIRGRRMFTGAPTTALHAYLRGEGLPRITQVEAGDDAWYWGAPLPDGTFSAMVFVDKEAAGEARGGRLEEVYRRWLGQSRLLGGCAGVAIDGEMRAHEATPYVDVESVGLSSLKIGEAAIALDPLSSSGVELSMRTAVVGSAAVHTMLSRVEDTRVAADFYAELLRESSALHAAWAAEHYRGQLGASARSFWRTRVAAAEAHAGAPAGGAPRLVEDLGSGPLLERRVRLAREVELVETGCLVGDFIESRRALRHPAFARPVAFVEGVEVGPLLGAVGEGTTLGDIVRRWAPRVPLRIGLRVAGWMLGHGVVIAA